MRYGKQAGFWATVAALGFFVAPVQGQQDEGVRSDYTQTPETATQDLNTDVRKFNPNADSNVPADRTDMSDGAIGGVYQPPRDRDPDTISDYRMHPNDLVAGPSGANFRNDQGTVTRGGDTSVNRPNRESQLNREREQRGLRGSTTRDTRERTRQNESRKTRTGGARTAPGTGTTGQTPSGITPWVTNPGATTAPNATVPGATAPGITTPGTTTPGATTAPGSVTTPGTTTPGVTTPGTTTPGGGGRTSGPGGGGSGGR